MSVTGLCRYLESSKEGTDGDISMGHPRRTYLILLLVIPSTLSTACESTSEEG